MENFLLGCCYYPEHWDKENLKSDIKKIKQLGFNCIRIGEFSWSLYEKEEGKYDFSFLGEAVKLAGELGLKVIVGTPTAAPPKWLIDKHPEVLCVNAEGVTMQHGARQHHNHTSPIYLQYCAKITTEMVKYFSRFPNVIGWQIDNEINCHRNESYSNADDIAFRVWLERKYGTIEKLNAAWGTCFWSLDFNDFSQVTCPRPHPAFKNPSYVTDYYLFLSDAAVDYAYLQTEIIRSIMPNAFITHNGYFQNIDYKKLTNKCLDFLSFDNYPSSREKQARGNGRSVAYRFAQTRACSKKFMILEQQAGPGGQLHYLHPTPLPGQLRLWTYQAIAHGAFGLIYFRYRTALFGAEQLWYGIYGHDGEENFRSCEIRQTAEELSRVGDLLAATENENEVAIFSNYHNACVDKVECFVENDSWNIFTALSKQNLHPDFIDENDDFDKYKVIILPHVTIANERLSQKIDAFCKNGGVAIISARSGVKDENAHYRPSTPPAVFRDVVGCKVEWFSSVVPYEKQSVSCDGNVYPVEDYCELLSPEKGEPVAFYTNGFLKDKPAVVKNGNAYYVGFYVREDASFYTDLVKRFVHCPTPVGEMVEQIRLGDYVMYLNHGDSPVSLCGYDHLKQTEFTSIPEFGVVLVKN